MNMASSQSQLDHAETCLGFEQVLAEIRQAASTGPVANALLERAFRLAATPEQEQQAADAAWPQRAPGETALLFQPYLWDLDSDSDSDLA